ncbi:hypothetical protein NDU88_001106 [Pleurodeles waltl]|uniref:Uncharacterized protein n=1 Tax=Pleurodeles waltl TaxID=8319 RepID=A0AAV7P4S1_PLEWA|nr:hypothetical protein NDU88_001106 [Pleurodeles waltl]
MPRSRAQNTPATCLPCARSCTLVRAGQPHASSKLRGSRGDGSARPSDTLLQPRPRHVPPSHLPPALQLEPAEGSRHSTGVPLRWTRWAYNALLQDIQAARLRQEPESRLDLIFCRHSR